MKRTISFSYFISIAIIIISTIGMIWLISIPAKSKAESLNSSIPAPLEGQINVPDDKAVIINQEIEVGMQRIEALKKEIQFNVDRASLRVLNKMKLDDDEFKVMDNGQGRYRIVPVKVFKEYLEQQQKAKEQTKK